MNRFWGRNDHGSEPKFSRDNDQLLALNYENLCDGDYLNRLFVVSGISPEKDESTQPDDVLGSSAQPESVLNHPDLTEDLIIYGENATIGRKFLQMRFARDLGVSSRNQDAVANVVNRQVVVFEHIGKLMVEACTRPPPIPERPINTLKISAKGTQTQDGRSRGGFSTGHLAASALGCALQLLESDPSRLSPTTLESIVAMVFHVTLESHTRAKASSAITSAAQNDPAAALAALTGSTTSYGGSGGGVAQSSLSQAHIHSLRSVLIQSAQRCLNPLASSYNGDNRGSLQSKEEKVLFSVGYMSEQFQLSFTACYGLLALALHSKNAADVLSASSHLMTSLIAMEEWADTVKVAFKNYAASLSSSASSATPTHHSPGADPAAALGGHSNQGSSLLQQTSSSPNALGAVIGLPSEKHISAKSALKLKQQQQAQAQCGSPSTSSNSKLPGHQPQLTQQASAATQSDEDGRADEAAATVGDVSGMVPKNPHGNSASNLHLLGEPVGGSGGKGPHPHAPWERPSSKASVLGGLDKDSREHTKSKLQVAKSMKMEGKIIHDVLVDQSPQQMQQQPLMVYHVAAGGLEGLSPGVVGQARNSNNNNNNNNQDGSLKRSSSNNQQQQPQQQQQNSPALDSKQQLAAKLATAGGGRPQYDHSPGSTLAGVEAAARGGGSSMSQGGKEGTTSGGRGALPAPHKQSLRRCKDTVQVLMRTPKPVLKLLFDVCSHMAAVSAVVTTAAATAAAVGTSAASSLGKAGLGGCAVGGTWAAVAGTDLRIIAAAIADGTYSTGMLNGLLNQSAVAAAALQNPAALRIGSTATGTSSSIGHNVLGGSRQPHVTSYVWSCGQNSYGELGLGDVVMRKSFTRVSDLDDKQIVSIGAGNEHSLFVTQDGKLLSSGYNDNGQCGMGTTQQVRQPTLVAALEGEDIVHVHVYNGCEHTLAVTREGKLYSFGYNYRGQLGLGNTTSESTPRPVRGLLSRKVVLAACSYHHSIMLCSDGQVITSSLIV